MADIFAKNWSLSRHWYLAAISLLMYLTANSFWLVALKNGSGLGRGAIVFSLFSAIIAVLLSVFIYHESFSRLQALGLVMGILALFFIFWE
ncbi:MAG: hypothetical protein EOM88_02755 [Clostridia bacterium]|nr:hypothetical protein [Clostridia bacterium]